MYEVFFIFIRSYMEHFMSYPRSLLVKVVGAYSVTSSYGPRYGKVSRIFHQKKCKQNIINLNQSLFFALN